GPAASAAAAIETGLLHPALGARIDASIVRRFEIDDLMSRSLALGARRRAFRCAAGFSQTGIMPDGWQSAGIACGVSRTLGGAAIRAVARRELAPGGDARETDHGAEIGGGAWVAATSDMIVWASAPQLRKWGASPPLRRALEIGARMERESFSLWASRAAPS